MRYLFSPPSNSVDERFIFGFSIIHSEADLLVFQSTLVSNLLARNERQGTARKRRGMFTLGKPYWVIITFLEEDSKEGIVASLPR